MIYYLHLILCLSLIPSITKRFVFFDTLDSSLYQNEKHYEFPHDSNLVRNSVMMNSAYDRNIYSVVLIY